MLLLEEFFRDKEPVYQEACSLCVMKEIENSVQLAVRFFDRDEFYKVESIIESRSDADLHLIGWEKDGIGGRIKHSFGYWVVSGKVNKVIRFMKKRFKVVFSGHHRVKEE